MSCKDRATFMLKPIYQTADSLEEAVQRIDEALPDVPRSRLIPLINMYHNTLLKTLIKEEQP